MCVRMLLATLSAQVLQAERKAVLWGVGGAGVGYVPLGASTQMAGVCSSRCCLIVTTARHNNNWNVYNTCIFSRVLAHALA